MAPAQAVVNRRMIPKKPAADLIRGGNRFSDKIMRKHKRRGGEG
jgi:hypothetical protein